MKGHRRVMGLALWGGSCELPLRLAGAWRVGVAFEPVVLLDREGVQ